MLEIWKDVPGYEEYYKVSNLGGVRSKHRVSRNGSGDFIRKPRDMHPLPNSSGYLRVQLTNGLGERQRFFVHRLVALAFIPNTLNKPHVNHIDSDFLNNRADNLEWVTIRENFEHALKKGRYVEAFIKLIDASKKQGIALRKPVIGINIITGETVRFHSLKEAGRNGFNAGGICECCKGTRQVHKGHVWEYEQWRAL